MWKILTAALLIGTGLPATASAYSGHYLPGYFQAVFQTFPGCGSGMVKSRIMHNFNWAGRVTFHHGVAIRGIDYEQERAIESFGPSPIDRRYCKARALLSNGASNDVYYRIERGMGLAGTAYKVEFCLPGYDAWRVYNGNCRVLRR